MTNTDEGILLRQATFDTDPFNLRDKGANIHLPVIEGDKEIKTIVSKEESVDIEKQSKGEEDEILTNVTEKNRTRIIDTKTDIDIGVKAISQKAKAHQREQKSKVETEKISGDTKNPANSTAESKQKDKTQTTDKKYVTGLSSEKPKPHQNANTKQASDKKDSQNHHLNENKKEPVSLKITDEKLKLQQKEEKDRLDSIQKQSVSKLPSNKVSEKEVVLQNKQQSSEKRDSAVTNVKTLKNKNKINQGEQNILYEGTKKKNDNIIEPVHAEDKNSNVGKKLSTEETSRRSHAKTIKLTQINEQKEDINPARVKVQSNASKEKVKRAASPLKENNKNQTKSSSQQNETAHKSDQNKDKRPKGITDKSKAKAGISISKDTHSASGNSVANGASPKPGETARKNEITSKLTVGSAPRITTLGGTQQSKTQKETNKSFPIKSQQNQAAVSNNTAENISNLETVKKLSEPRSTINTNKITTDKIGEESNSSLKDITMDNTGPIRAEVRRGETYEALYAERNTLIKAEIAYKKRIKQLEDEANSFLKNIEDLSSENNRLHSRLENLETELKSKKQNNMEETAFNLEQENEELKKKLKELENASITISNSNKSSEQSGQQITELKTQVIKLQTENQTVNEELIKIKAELLSESRKLHALEKEKNSLANSVTAVESEKLDKIHDLQNEHSKLKKENKAQKDRIEELEKKLNTLEYENKTLSESLTQKKSELDELLGVMKDENKFDNEIKDMKNLVVKLEKDKKDMELKYNGEKRKLLEELEEIKSKYEKSNSELQELKIKYDEVASKNKKYIAENKTLTSVRDSQKKEIDELKREIERLKNELKEIQKKLDNLKDETENATTDLKKAKVNLEDTNKELQSVVSEKEGQISKLTSQVDNLNAEKAAEKKEFEHETEKLAAEIDGLKVFEKHMNSMERELKHFVEKLEESENQKTKLLDELEDKDYKISALEKQLFELNMKIDTLTKRIGQLDREKREAENDRRDWEVKRDKVNDIESSNKRLLEENRRLRASLETKHFQGTNTATTAEKTLKGREAWVEEVDPIDSSQKAVYVENKHGKKRVQIATQPVIQKRRDPFTKSSPAKPTKTLAKKKNFRTSLSPSRSLEDIRRSPASPADSNPSLPELQKDGRLTYGFSYNLGYSQIHRNRIKAAHKRVY